MASTMGARASDLLRRVALALTAGAVACVDLSSMAPASATGESSGDGATTAAADTASPDSITSTSAPGSTASTGPSPTTDSTGPATTGSSSDDSSSGVTTSTGDDAGPATDATDAGAPTTSGTGASESTTTSDDAGTTTGSTTTGNNDDDDDGGDGGEPCPLDCDPPCDLVLSEGLSSVTTLGHDGTRIAARDYEGKVIVFDATSLDGIYIEHDTTWMALASGVLAIAHGDEVVLRSSASLDVLGAVAAAPERGLALDGSYLWAAGAGGIQTYATDGDETSSTPGTFTDVHVLALPDALHVHAESYAEQSVLHIDLATGVVDEVIFEGEFGGWFGDTPRFWSQQGMAYRLFEPDGSEIAFGLGSVVHGWGDYVIGPVGVAHISDVDVSLLAITGTTSQISGPAMATYDFDGGTGGTIFVLDAAGPQTFPFPTTCCAPLANYGWRFAWSPSGWAVSRGDGIVGDHLDRTTSVGPITDLVGAIGGRFVAAIPETDGAIWDVTPACGVQRNGSVARTPGRMGISPDGSALATWMQNPDVWWTDRGTQLLALPGGEDLAFVGSNACSYCGPIAWSMSTDASVAAHLWAWTGAYESDTFAIPAGTVWTTESGSNVLPAIAPDGLHAIITDAPWGSGASYDDSVSYVYEEGVFLDVFDGVTWGFLDDAHVLVSHYESDGGFCDNAGDCDTLLGSEIAEIDGTIVQATNLPDVRRFQRISDTEILVVEPPRIYDAYTGEVLWSMPDVDFAVAIDPSLVAWSDGVSLVVHRWR